MGSRESVVVDVLGPFRVRVGDRPVELPPGRQRVLLAALAMSAGRAVSVDRLSDLIWGDDLPANARRTVQTYVTRLRQVLGADAITTEPAGYVLQTPPDAVDALRFLRLVERAGREPDVERELLAEALRLWRGESFEDLESDVLRASEGDRLTEQRLTATERRIDLELADGRSGDVVAELRDLTGRHPLREPLWTRLLVALAASGRQAEALEQYEVVRTRIADELGVDPGADLQRVYADLLHGAAPEVGAEGSTQSAPVVPKQLPVGIAGFVGRKGALSELDQALADAAGIVAVCGTGGVGKTTLALRWAHRAAEHFPDGQLYVNLRGYGAGNPVAPAAALDTLLRGLGMSGEQIPADVDARENLLRSALADRRILVLLDNARSVEQVRPLLPGTPGPMVLVTSRSQLRGLVVREGAHRVGLDQLPPAESAALLDAALGVEASRADLPALLELADRCGHLPLALAIAAERASRIPGLGLTELIDELRIERERLDALDTGEESTDLRAVFTWSYQALDDDTVRLFRLLGLYPGPDFGLPAAAALAGTTSARTRRLLDRLVDGNLVQHRRSGRYELHDLIREYAAELTARLDTEADRAVALERLLEWFLHSAVNGRKVLSSVPPLVDVGEPTTAVSPTELDSREQAMAWFDVERPSLVAAVRRAADLESDRATHHLVEMTWGYLMRRRAFDDMLRLLPLAAEAAARTDDPVARAQTANLLGMTYGEMLDDERSATYFRQAIELFERAGHDDGQARTHGNLGVVLLRLDQMEDAAHQLERAIEFGRRLRDERIVVNPMYNLASAYRQLKRYDEADEVCREALDIARRLDEGDTVETGMAILTLAEIRAARGRTSEAIDLFREAIELLRGNADHWYEGTALTNLGRALRDEGRTDEAREAWQRALRIFDEFGAPDGATFSRSELTELLATVE